MSNMFVNEDGTYTRKVYGRPVNYRAADGTWTPIDTRLVRGAGDRWHMAANRLDVSLSAGGAGTGDLATMRLDTGEVVGWDLVGAAAVTPQVDGGDATYYGILPQTDLQLEAFDSGIKETLILRSPDAPAQWVFPLRLQGLTPRLTPAGAVELLGSAGTAVAWLPAGFMEDSNVDPRSGEPAQGSVHFELTTVDGGPALRVTADQAWLADPARVFPVRVDPTSTTGTTGDVYIDNYSGTTNHNGDNLPIGTYNSGTVKARSFIHLADFASTFSGKRITSAKLHLYHTWSYDCNNHRTFYVRAATQSWTVANLATAPPSDYPGPSVSGAIGSLKITDNYPACLNSSANRSVGQWWAVPLNVATFNDWSSGGSNLGLALTTSETDSYAWKRFTSANYASGAYKAYLEVTYTNNVAPQVNVRYPANNAALPTLTPTFLVKAKDPDAYPNKGLTYKFTVYDSSGTAITNSGWTSSTSWTVPSGQLVWNTAYLYTVQVYDKVSYSGVYPAYAFTTSVPQPLVTSNLAQNADKGFDPSVGNYTTSATDATVATVGPSLSVTRVYNSLDTRRDSAFGTGWSSIVDTRAAQMTEADGSIQSVVITYPTGQDVAFGRNADGTFTPPSGRFSTLVETSSSGTVTGYTLTDKDATVYEFARSAGSGVFKISSVTDAVGRRLTFGYDGSNNLVTMTSVPSGRALHFTWKKQATAWYGHVTAVSTDEAIAGDPNSVGTWQYSYDPYDKLISVCPPTDATHCTTYDNTLTSSVPNVVLDSGPYSYWRLDEASGTTAASSVLSNAGVDNGRYNNVALGQPAAFVDSTATSAGFNGTSSYVQLPGKLIADGQYQSVSMWFKTTATNGVLFSYSSDPLTKSSTSSSYTPALYIGSDGKLHAEFYMGSSSSAMVYGTPVNNGAWHHVALVGMGNTQTLYVDGSARATLSGTIALANPTNNDYVYVGAGFVGGGWPGHVDTGASPAVRSYFNGTISDVAFYNRALSADAVYRLRKAGTYAHAVLSKIVRPSGGVSAQISYDKTTGKVSTVTDSTGGVWQLGQPVIAGDSGVYAASVLGAKPRDYWRLGETGVTEAVNEVHGDDATLNSVNLGVAGPFADSTAAQFQHALYSDMTLPDTGVDTASSFSVSAWVKLTDGTRHQRAVSINGLRVPGFWLGYNSNGQWQATMYQSDTDSPPSNRVGKTATLNTWTSLVGAYDGSTRKLRLYVNGQLAGETTVGGTAWTATGQLAVGRGLWNGSATDYWEGDISDVAIFESTLSEQQIAAQYAASQQTAPVAVTIVDGVQKPLPMPVESVTVTGPTGEHISYSYDLVNGNRPVAQTDALGNTTKFGYDVGGFGSLVYDPRGVWTQALHDIRGNTIQKITCQDQQNSKCSSVYFTYYPDDTTAKLSPDARNDVMLTMRDGRSASATDNTYLTTYAYDAQGNRISATDPLGRVTSTTYTDGTTVAAYDGGFAPPGLPSTMTTAGGATQHVDYYANGDLAQITDPAGKITRFVYDGLGRKASETEITDTFPAGLTISYAYDKLGRELQVTDPAVTNRVTGAVHTAVSTTTYDYDGNVVSETVSDASGGDAPRTEAATYNSYGEKTSETDAAGAISSYEYDVYGNITKETEPDGGVTKNTYDVEGNLLTTSVAGFTGDPNNPQPATDLLITSNAYDPAGRLASETDAMGWTTSYTYTDNGLTAKTTRSDGATTFVVEEDTYDAAGNLIKQVTNEGATTTTFDTDAAGRTYRTTLDPGGLNRITTQSYNADDNVVSTVVSDGSATLGRSDALLDPLGRPLAETTYTSTALSPVARWKLAETSGTTAADSAGNNPATALGGVTWSTEHGGSAVFNGTDAVIQTGDPAVDTSRSFSFAAWVKLAAKTADSYVAVMPGSIGNSAFKLNYNAAADRWHVAMAVRNADGTNSWIVADSPTGLPTIGAWTHLVVAVDADGRTIKLYVDGALQATYTSSKPFNNHATGMNIGSEYDTLWWNGSISDVQVYQDALSASQVTAIHNGTAPAADAGVVRASFGLDQDGLTKSVTDPNGGTTYYDYDEAGRLVESTAPAVMTETVTQNPVLAHAVSWRGYDTFDELTDAKDPNGNWTVNAYDAAGRLVSTKLPSYTPPGSSTSIVPEKTWSYNALGQVTTETDPLGRATGYAYDQLGRVWKVTQPNLGVATYTYDHLGDMLSSTDADGAVSGWTYDFMGRKLTSTATERQTGGSFVTHYTYGPGGWLSQVTTPDGVTDSTTYDPAGEPLTATDGAGNTTRFTYDGVGQLTRTTLADNTYTTNAYDLAGRSTGTAAYDAQGTLLQSASTGYDRAGNVVAATDARGHTATIDYDATGVPTRLTEPISGSDSIVTTFGYDLAGNRTRYTDGRGNSYLVAYNPLGLPESQIEPVTTAQPNLADRTFTFTYDAAGEVTNESMPGGVSVTNQYDVSGNLIRRSGSGAEVATTDQVFGYDPVGRLTNVSGVGGGNSISYDDRGLPTSVTGPSGDSSFGYTGDGQVATRTDAAGTTTYQYDAAGRLSGIANPAAGVQTAYNYNTLNQLDSITYGGTGNVRRLGYDSMHRLVSDDLQTPSATSIAKIDYGWNANGDLTSKTTTGFSGSAANTYTYDYADRLTSWYDGTATTVYAYDKAGNRVQAGSKLFTYDERNRLLTADGATYQYTPRGTLASVSDATGTRNTASDAFGQVLSQDGTGGTQSYSYDGLGRVIRPGFAYTGLGNDLASDGGTSYVRDPSGALVGAAGAAGQRYMWTDIHTDVVGQFTATSTALDGSTTYDPLGKVLSTASMLGSLGYQSEWTDALTGRVNMLSRWYNPDTGQFDSRDSANNSPIPDSINANRYQYGDGNPLTVTDPSGHWGWNPFKAAAHAIKSVTSTVSSAYHYTYSHAYSSFNYMTSYASSRFNSARSYASTQYHKAVKHVKKAVKHVKKKVAAAKKYVKRKAAAAKRWVKKKVKAAHKYVARKIHQVKHKLKRVAKRVKQAAKKVRAVAVRVARDPVGAVKDAATATKKWVKDHKDVLIEAAAIGGAILAGLACTAVTAGAGALACIAGAGALINVAKDAAEGNIHSLGDALMSGGTGALSGLVGGAGGMLGAKAGALVASKLGTGLIGKIGSEVVDNAVSDIADQALTTRHVSMKNTMLSMVPGMSLLHRKGGGGLHMPAAAHAGSASHFGLPSPRRLSPGREGGIGGRSPSGCHSFDPNTRVVMADGTTRPIKDVNVGDQVTSTDPNNGTTSTEPVVALHRNHDTDLTDLTLTNSTGPAQATAGTPASATTGRDPGSAKPGRVKTAVAALAAAVAALAATATPAAAAPNENTGTGTGTTVVLHTTQNHPFWDATTGTWVNAADLAVGHRLRTLHGQIETVVAVHNHTATNEMRDLTIAHIHTYYVLAGDTPVLVHNTEILCGVEVPDGVTAKSEAHITGTGDTVLGHFRPPPSYVDKAVARGASYYSIDDATWSAMTKDQRWAANEHFLDVIADRGDRVLLSHSKQMIRPGSDLEREINHLTNNWNYRWVNQWSLRPR